MADSLLCLPQMLPIGVARPHNRSDGGVAIKVTISRFSKLIRHVSVEHFRSFLLFIVFSTIGGAEGGAKHMDFV